MTNGKPSWIQAFGDWTNALGGALPLLAVIGLLFISWSDLNQLKATVAAQQATMAALCDFKTAYDAQAKAREDLNTIIKSHLDRLDIHQTPVQIRSSIGEEIRPLSEQMVKMQTIQEQNQRQLTRMEDLLLKISTNHEKTVIGSR